MKYRGFDRVFLVVVLISTLLLLFSISLVHKANKGSILGKAGDGAIQSDNNPMNGAPTHTEPLIDPINPDTTKDIICINQSTSDPDGDTVTNIYNWLQNDDSITVLNMPFDTQTNSPTDNVKDYSGSGNDGTLSSNIATPTWTRNGKIGGAYSFNGIDEAYISVPDAPSLRLMNYTLSFWMKLNNPWNTNTLTSHGIISKVYNISGMSYGLLHHEGFPGRLTAIHSGDYLPTIKNSWNANEWYFITLSRDQSMVYLFVNGVLDTSASSRNPFYDNEPIYIGEFPAGPHVFDGTIDDVKIYNIALSAEQIYQNYQEGLNGIGTSTIVSEELTEGDIWQCDVIPNDNQVDGEILSNLVYVQSGPSSDYPMPIFVSPPTPLNGTRMTANNLTILARDQRGSSWDKCTFYINGLDFDIPASGANNSFCEYSMITLDGQTYIFGVAATNAAGTEYIDEQRTVHENAKPTTPNLISPENNTVINSTNVTLVWSNSTDVDGDEIYYCVRLYTNYSGGVQVCDDINQYSFYNLSNYTYYWYVIASDSIEDSARSEERILNFNNPTTFNFPPVINRLYLSSQNLYNDETLIFYANVTDIENGLMADSCIFELFKSDLTPNITNITTNTLSGEIISRDVLTSSYGVGSLEWKKTICNDSAGNNVYNDSVGLVVTINQRESSSSSSTGSGGSSSSSSSSSSGSSSSSTGSGGFHNNYTVQRNFLENIFAINITATMTNPNISVTKTTNTVAPIPNTEGYEFYQIVSQTNIISAIVYFKVPKTWIVQNSINISTIGLYKYSVGAWNKLPTTKVSEDTNNIYFKAYTLSFSLFGIAGNRIGVQEIIPETPVEPEMPEYPLPIPEDNLPNESDSTSNNGMFAIFGAIGFGVIIGGLVLYFFIFKKRNELSPEKIEELRIYINACRLRGYNDEQIKTNMLNSGWDKKSLETMFKKGAK